MTPEERIKDLSDYISDLKRRREALGDSPDESALVAKLTTAAAMCHRELDLLCRKNGQAGGDLDSLTDAELEKRATAVVSQIEKARAKKAKAGS